jgi:hypothetical protein
MRPLSRYHEGNPLRLRARQPLRGLMSSPKSLSFQGCFGRMFRSLPAATYGVTDAESRLALMTLSLARKPS